MVVFHHLLTLFYSYFFFFYNLLFFNDNLSSIKPTFEHIYSLGQREGETRVLVYSLGVSPHIGPGLNTRVVGPKYETTLFIINNNSYYYYNMFESSDLRYV